MIHCICNSINTKKIDEAAACGIRKAKDVQTYCGTRFACGQCKSSIQARLDLVTQTESPALAAE